MRHVIIGSHTAVGSSIVRLLASIKAKNVVAISPRGEAPDGVDPKAVKSRFGDVIDIYTLNDLLEEGDIVYNCQIISSESADVGDAELYNNSGIINLLGVGSLVGVDRIIMAFPQALGYKFESKLDEETLGKNPSPIQETLRNGLEAIYNYWDGKPFGWRAGNLAKFGEQAERDANDGGSSPEEPSSGPSTGPTAPSKGPSTGGPSIGPKSPSSPGPSLGGPSTGGPSLGPKSPSSPGPSLGGPSTGGSSLGPKSPSSPGPSLGGSSVDSDNPPSSPSSGPNSAETKETVAEGEPPTVENGGPDPVEEPQVEIDRVPVIVARIARLFGPFDDGITTKFCRSVRIQRMSVVGELDKSISWINPIDAGRAMIVLGDLSLHNGEEEDEDEGDEDDEVIRYHFNINGFTASPKEILDRLDKINHSELDLEVTPITKYKITHFFKKGLKKLGLKLHDPYFEYLQYNIKQDFEDEKARSEFGWEPKYDLDRTSKEALNWFTSHKL